MRTDPCFDSFLATPGMQAKRPPPGVTAADMRAAMRGAPNPAPRRDIASVHDLEIAGPAGPLRLRIYHPCPGESRPVILFFHGGGWVFGDLDTHDPLCRAIAIESGCAVAAVDYRLAPEARFPSQPEDCYAALQAIATHPISPGLDTNRLAVCGDSAGGNLAAAVAILARDRGGPRLRHQVLIYPITDAGCDSASMRECASGYMLSREIMQWFWECYMPDQADGSDALASVLRVSSVASLPSATVLTAELDPLRDEGEAYAAKLRAAGISVTTRRYMGMIHGFVGMPHLTGVANRAIVDLAQDLRAALA